MAKKELNFESGSIESILLNQSRSEIEYLRRLYAKATDLIGISENNSLRNQGIEIYHKIFSPEASISAGAEKLLKANGPDEWVNVVISALDKYVSTQHLIGTQIVEFSSFEVVKNEISSGEACMTSYLQAWHAWPDNRLRVVMGTYQDTVRYKSGIGWQIDKMHLEHTSTDHRMLGKTFD